MNSKNYFTLNILIFFIFSIILTIYFVGPSNFWFNKTNWLYGAGDLTNAQLSWQYFQVDEWHFPIGKNPNYGLEISNSIIFTDSIPLLAFIFKLLSPVIYSKFQYFSFWILICFFLQLFFAYILLLKITKDNLYSFLGSFLFLLSPFFFFRLSFHFSLGAHWLLLYAFYICYVIDKDHKSIHWFLLITLSLLIHLYFTLMLFVILSCFVFEEIFTRKSLKPCIFLIGSIFYALIFMYIVGYFESSPINSVSSGYGEYKIDLFSFFDPKISAQESWSYFLKDLNITHLEGFNYIGLGNILFFLSVIILFSFNYKVFKQSSLKIFRLANIYIIIFFIWALTTNLSINGNKIFNINLNDYILGLLSIFSSTGRFAWPVIYIFLIFSTVYLHKNLKNLFSNLFITLILIIQILDISIGIKNNSFKTYETKKYDSLWYMIDKEFDEIRTTYLYNNYGPLFYNFSKILGNLNNIKTDITLNASLDREKAAYVRYKLIKDINEKKLSNKTAYIIDNKGHLNQLKNATKGMNFGFFYRDEFWIMLPNKRGEMSDDDILKLRKINFEQLSFKKKYKTKFKDNFLGFGWTHNFGKQGVWTEGENAFILFQTPKVEEVKKMTFEIEPYKSNQNKNFQLQIFLNEKLQKTILLNTKKNTYLIEVPLKKNDINIDNVINFRLSGLIAPIDIFESPDARKLGVLLKSFKFE